MEKCMKTTYSALAIVIVSMTFTAAASGGGQDRIPELQRDGALFGKSVTLTGCVTQGTEPGTFTLTNVPEGDGAAKDAPRPLTVVLSATDVDISKHLNQMVSVIGTQAFEVAAIATTGRNGGDKKPPPTFTITSLKMVAVSCAKPAL
jgi:hypothetical protein